MRDSTEESNPIYDGSNLVNKVGIDNLTMIKMVHNLYFFQEFFRQSYQSYQDGFRSPTELWLGLDRIKQ